MKHKSSINKGEVKIQSTKSSWFSGVGLFLTAAALFYQVYKDNDQYGTQKSVEIEKLVTSLIAILDKYSNPDAKVMIPMYRLRVSAEKDGVIRQVCESDSVEKSFLEKDASQVREILTKFIFEKPNWKHFNKIDKNKCGEKFVKYSSDWLTRMDFIILAPQICPADFFAPVGTDSDMLCKAIRGKCRIENFSQEMSSEKIENHKILKQFIECSKLEIIR